MNMNAGKVAMVVSFVAVMAVSVLAAGKSSAAQGDVTTAVAGQKNVVHHGTWISFETSSAECSVCHAQLYAQWRFAAGSDLKTVGQGTNHAISSTEPVYKALFGAVDPTMQVYCRGCHESGNAWAVADKINDIPAPRTVNVEEGINCLVCHLDGKKIMGSRELQDPIFCASCHSEKSGLTDIYKEWLADYTGGKTCQQCHMEGGSHLFLGYNSPSYVKTAVAISEPVISGTVSAGSPFDIGFTLTNYGAGHSVPGDLLRLLRARVSIVDSSQQEIYSQETVYYKRHPAFGENQADTSVIKAGETKQVGVSGVVIASPGIYTVKIELLQDSNRMISTLSTTAFMGSTYRTIVVQ